jgi:SRSO17 transposase
MRSSRRVSPEASARFEAFVAALLPAFGHADRAAPMRAYALGLLVPGAAGERKSVEPMAARVAPTRVRAMPQAMHHFIATAPWSATAVLATVRDYVLPAFRRHGGVQAWIVDDTGVPKKGRHSVGVTRQYCGQRGKQENGQVAVSLSVANAVLSLPIAYQLYLPEAWTTDAPRRAQAGVPRTRPFPTKPQLALTQLDAALAAGVPTAPVLADAAYGTDTAFRDGLTERGLPYAVGIHASTSVWPAGQGPLPPRSYRGRGRPPTTVRHTATHRPIAVQALALAAPASAWRTVTWREAERGLQRSRFFCTRGRPAHRETARRTPRPAEWLLVEWPVGADTPTKSWLSTLPATIPLRQLVRVTKLRWRSERDYQELKQELGLTHYEGRRGRGFHHHATMCIATYALLLLDRARFSPSGSRSGSRLRGAGRAAAPVSACPPGRGAPPPARAPQSHFAHDAPRRPTRHRTATPVALPVLLPGSGRPRTAVA